MRTRKPLEYYRPNPQPEAAPVPSAVAAILLFIAIGALIILTRLGLMFAPTLYSWARQLLQ